MNVGAIRKVGVVQTFARFAWQQLQRRYCLEQAQIIRPVEKRRMRAASPEDRLLHHTFDISHTAGTTFEVEA